MIESILRRFAFVRGLESESSRYHDAMVEAQAQAELWRERATSAEAEVKSLNAQLVDEAHRVADHFSARVDGRRVYTQASTVPPPDTIPHTATLGSGRQQARAVQIEQTRKTMDELNKLWDSVSQD